jgi:hypothetical protein
MFHPTPLGRRNKRILKNKNDHENEKEQQPTVIFFTLKQLEVYLKCIGPISLSWLRPLKEDHL